MGTWVVEEPKWHWTIQQCLSRFQDQGILCDTSLACANGKTIRAHSCILAAASERIRNLFKGVLSSDDYTLRMDSVTSTTWHYILRFIYDGRVALPLDQVERVKDAAIRFQIVPLINLLNTLERLRGQIGSTESNVSRETPTTSGVDRDDVIVLDDDDDDGVVVVETEPSTVTSVTVPTADNTANIPGSDGDRVELGSSPSQSSPTLPESSNDVASLTTVPPPTTTSRLDDLCASVSIENTIVSGLGAHESGTSDKRPSDICGQSTNADGIGSQVLSESYSSSQFSSVVQNTSQYTVLRDARCSSNDTNEAFNVSEVIRMDSPASETEDKETEKTCNHSKSSAIRRNSCNPPGIPSFRQQPASVASSHGADIYRQFIVSRPSGITPPSDVDERERTDMLPVEQLLQTATSEGLFAHEPEASVDQYGLVDGPQKGPEYRPWEDRIEDEAPLLCISDVVSLSGQMTDFDAPQSAFNVNNNSLCNLPLTTEAEFATDDLRTRTSCVESGSSSVTPFLSVLPPTTVKIPVVNSTELTSETTKTKQGSNYTKIKLIPRSKVPLSTATVRIKFPSSSIGLSKDAPHLFNGSRASMQQSSMSNLPGTQPHHRFLLVRSAEAAQAVSTLSSTPTPTGSSVPPGEDVAEEAPLKNPCTFVAERTTPQQPQLVKKSVGLKRGPKRRKPMPPLPVETAEPSAKASGDATEYEWPGESRQFSDCTELVTDHDHQKISQTWKPSVVDVKHLLKSPRLTNPRWSIVGPSGEPDSQVTDGTSFADETSCVQPDSTVLEPRPLPLPISVYNFNESDSDSNNVLPERLHQSITSTRPTGDFQGGTKVAKRSKEITISVVFSPVHYICFFFLYFI